jgi:hypothetical protein
VCVCVCVLGGGGGGLLFKNLSFMVGYVIGLDCSLEFLVKEI